MLQVVALQRDRVFGHYALHAQFQKQRPFQTLPRILIHKESPPAKSLETRPAGFSVPK